MRHLRCASGVVLAAGCVSGALGQVVLDGTVGPVGPLAGPDFAVTADLGTTSGSNLFHSFSQFSLSSGESATFSGPVTVQRVLARVTGGDRSQVNGLIRSTIAGADLILINPAGVTFGPDASLDVSGSFAATSASALHLSDGGVFDAGTPGASVLTAAAVSEFGFLDGEASLVVDGSILTGADGEVLSLVGAGVELASTVESPGGRVNLVSVAGDGRVVVDPADPAGSVGVGSFAELGEVMVGFNGLVSADGEGGGSVVIRGRRLVMDFATVSVFTTGGQAGGVVDVEVTDDVVLLNGASLRTGVFNADGGVGADVRVVAGTVEMTGFSALNAGTSVGVDSGNVIVEADHILLGADGSAAFITTDPAFFDPGNAGNVEITAGERVLVAGGSFVGSGGFMGGAAGNIWVSGPVVDVVGSFIGSGGQATSDGGDVRIEADELNVTDFSQVFGGVFSGSASGGMIEVVVGRLNLLRGSAIAADNAGSGQIAGVSVMADDILIDGEGGPFFTGISAQVTGTGGGPGADVTVDTGGLTLVNNALIATNTWGTGDAGTLTVFADNILMDREGSDFNTGIESTTLGFPVGGQGGDIFIGSTDRPVSELVIQGAGRLGAESVGNGDGGNIEVHADRVMIDHGDGPLIGVDGNPLTTGIAVGSSGPAEGSGRAGDIVMDVGELVVLSNGKVTSNTSGPGAGGAVQITAGSVLVSGEGASINAGSSDVLQDGADIAVVLDITHSISADLRVVLVSPSGTRVTLIDQQETFGGEGFAGTVLDDRAILEQRFVPPSFTNLLRPEEPLASLVGEPVDGVWTLEIEDLNPTFDQGELVAWSLRIGGQVFESVDVGLPIDLFTPETLLVSSVLDVDGTVLPGAPAVVETGLLNTTSGDGGLVSVTGGWVGVVDGGSISATTLGRGDAGSVVVAADHFEAGGGGRVESAATGSGNAGGVTVTAADTVRLNPGGVISATADQSNGGDLTVASGNKVLLHGGEITARAGLDGGNIEISTVSLVRLVDARVTAEAGIDGGNILIDPVAVVLDSSEILANAILGDGGDITIIADVFLVTPDSVISASSQFGVSGTIAINSPDADLAGSLAPLSGALAGEDAQFLERCAVRLGDESNSFTVIGSGGAPSVPGGWLPAIGTGAVEAAAGSTE